MTNNFINLRYIVYSPLLWLCSACSFYNGPEVIFQDYQQRLENVLAQQINADANPLTFATFLPGTTQPEERQIKLNEFYQLPECGIKPLIAERNTSLGKLHSPSIRLHYEVKLHMALTRCVAITSGNEQMQVKQLREKKVEDLLAARKTLLNASSEIRQSINTMGVFLENDAKYRSSEVAWKQIANLLSSIQSRDVTITSWEQADLETQLKTLSEQKWLARTINTMALFNHYLPGITRDLITATRPITCHSLKEKTQVEYLRNIFQMFFIEQLQPMASQINDGYYGLYDTIRILYLAEDSPKQAQHYIKIDYVEAFQQFRKNLQAHVTFWQGLFATCAIQPTV
ncbi:MAG: DUF3080 family protein [Aestuariibacter sp.]